MDGGTGTGTSDESRARATPSSPATRSSPARRGFMYTGDIKNAWNHAARKGNQGFKCLYCEREYVSGGKTRLTQHLAAFGKSIGPCNSVPKEVRAALRKQHFEKMLGKKEARECSNRIERELVQEMRGDVIDVDAYDGARTEIAIRRSIREMELQREVDRNGGTSSGTTSRTASCGRVLSQPRIDHAFDKTKADRIGEAWARFFHANDVPGRKANCYYFRAALLLSMELGVVQPLPKGSDIDGKYLVANRMELEDFIKDCRDDWEQFGVTVMCDSWTGPTSMSIINFMVYCNEKMLFHKSVNATGKIQNADFLYEIEREERDLDAISIINDTALFQQDNPIMDWLNHSMSESSPLLDEDGSPSQFVIEEIRRNNMKRKLGRVGRKVRRKSKKLSVLAKNCSSSKGKNVMQTEDDSEEEDDFAESDSDDDEHNVESDDNSLDDHDDVSNEEENGDEEMHPSEETGAARNDGGDVQQEREITEPVPQRETRSTRKDRSDVQQEEIRETVRQRVSKRAVVPRKDPNSHYY